MTTARWIEYLLQPAAAPPTQRLASVVAPLLALSAMLVLIAASAMPDSYSWRAHSISESAAQGLEHAWIARLSFVCFGLAVFILSVAARPLWPRLTYWCNLVFSIAMFAAAAFSHAPWLPGEVADRFEDFLHSVAATGMGFAYSIGVVARFAQRPRGALVGRALDALSLITAVILPLLLASASDVAGLAQRIMFGIAYVWFGREALIAASRLSEGRPSHA